MELTKTSSVISLIFFVLIFIFSLMKPSQAVCCEKAGYVIHTCPIYQRCTQHICMDGSNVPAHNYCGHGSCDIFGCNCDGGCRKNSLGTFDEAARLFEKREGVFVLFKYSFDSLRSGKIQKLKSNSTIRSQFLSWEQCNGTSILKKNQFDYICQLNAKWSFLLISLIFLLWWR